tara:strand:- start:122 stop:340 length:219 start_codon:yes stop_codon:yes gene_type:complete
MEAANPLTPYPNIEQGVARMMKQVYGVEINESASTYDGELDAWQILTSEGVRGLAYLSSSDLHRHNDYELED